MKRLFVLAVAVLAAAVFVPVASADDLHWYLDPTWDCGQMDPAQCEAAKQAKAQEVRAERQGDFARDQIYDFGACVYREEYVSDYLDRYDRDVADVGVDAMRAEAIESYAQCQARESAKAAADKRAGKRVAERRRKASHAKQRAARRKAAALARLGTRCHTSTLLTVYTRKTSCTTATAIAREVYSFRAINNPGPTGWGASG
jgi:hypothetical protein